MVIGWWLTRRRQSKQYKISSRYQDRIREQSALSGCFCNQDWTLLEINFANISHVRHDLFHQLVSKPFNERQCLRSQIHPRSLHETSWLLIPEAMVTRCAFSANCSFYEECQPHQSGSLDCLGVCVTSTWFHHGMGSLIYPVHTL